MSADTLRIARARRGIVGPQSIEIETSPGFRAAWRLFLKNTPSSTLMRGAAAPVSTRDAVEAKGGHGCRRNNQAATACLRVSRVTLRTMAGHTIAAASAHAAHSGSHSVVSNQRKLRSYFRNACQEYESQGGV